jgi:hypothetical protein
VSEESPGSGPVPVASSGTADNPHAHLDPVVEAELSWGNEVAEDWHVVTAANHQALALARPFHVDALRERFRFPRDVGLYVIGARSRKEVPMMHLSDWFSKGHVTAPLPGGWPNADLAVPLAPDEPGDDRRPIAAIGWLRRPQAHLEPIVAAELSWGNRIDYDWRRTDKLLDDRTLRLTSPFHLDRLRATFRFPPNVRMYANLPGPRPGQIGRVLISDFEDYVNIEAPLPEGWPYGTDFVDL